MKVTLLKEEDKKRAKILWGYAFERDEPFYSWYFDNVYDENNCVGIYDDELVSYLQLNPYNIKLNNNIFPTSYVVGVISAPEYRNKGAMKKLLPKALEEMNNKGHWISILMPFDTNFYSPYGWELSYSQLKYHVPIDVIKGLKNKSGDFRKIKIGGSTDSLNEIYESYLYKYNGYVKRNPKEWEYIMHEVDSYGGYMYILTINDNPCGYIFYHIEDKILSIREMAYTNLEGMGALFNFIYSHTSQVTHVNWPAPIGDNLYLFIKDTIKPEFTNDIRVHPFMCTRVINVKNAIENCIFQRDTQFIFTVDDTYAPWNNNTYKISITNGKASVTMVDPIYSQFSCNINTFSQLFFGSIDIYEGKFLNKVNITDESGIHEFNKVFYKKDNFINEYF
ncbi:MAG: GNAT family N-acetyltransferase [Anaeromicrobium sp.]|uniref:GNAT family N-acetyltransferase n=1 Tax=Anaeromicrobium sp. TaxID=1929132 RepID=UPI0025F80550|nr:GNAT family N-acetyltransferase [Anaeromicrobium sp.]MCT4593757.1 GNAT family N-acetyltransferase [Anaeromicrobium sp.]